jgi:hypothetical protein
VENPSSCPFISIYFESVLKNLRMTALTVTQAKEKILDLLLRKKLRIEKDLKMFLNEKRIF